MDEEELIKREKAIEELWKIENKERNDIKQINKNRWCLEGDENSKLFHRCLNKKKRKRNVKGILSDGIWHTDPTVVKDCFFDHFKDRFKENTDINWEQDFSGLKCLSNEQSLGLEKDFDEEEIKRAIWDCGEDKSPGPDGFNMEFIKKCGTS